MLLKLAAWGVLPLLWYIIYKRLRNSLSSYPGPFLASFTPLWRVYHELLGDTPQVLQQYHLRHGPVLRVAPNELVFSSPGIIDDVYKQGRRFPKSDFYDGFTAIRPNIFEYSAKLTVHSFGTRDEALHALRRRQMAHGFSTASFTKMEYIFDRHLVAFIKKLSRYADSGVSFDLKKPFAFFAQDVNGELSFSAQFGTQDADDTNLLPPNNDHILLSKLLGYVPDLKPFVTRWGLWIPWPYLNRLLTSRMALRARAEASAKEEVEKHRVHGAERSYEDDKDKRVNLLTSLVEAKDPETGAELDLNEIAAEALSFLGAGSHSTAASLAFLFWHLLYEPGVMANVMKEIKHELPTPLGGVDDDVLSYAGLEHKLPYLSATMKESFRLSPTVQNPLPRVVPVSSELICGMRIPPGTAVGASIFSLHRNPDIWGADAEEFRPERWLKDLDYEGIQGNEKYLLHFGAGHRACIGRNMALISMWKSTAEFLRRFDIESSSGAGSGQKQPVLKMRVSGFAQLEGPLLVRIKKR